MDTAGTGDFRTKADARSALAQVGGPERWTDLGRPDSTRVKAGVVEVSDSLLVSGESYMIGGALIGATTAPSYTAESTHLSKLRIGGSSTSPVDSLGQGALQLRGYSSAPDMPVGVLEYLDGRNNESIARIRAVRGSNGYGSGALAFLTADTSGVMSEKVRITNTGQVQADTLNIGGGTADSALTVTGGSHLGSTLFEQADRKPIVQVGAGFGVAPEIKVEAYGGTGSTPQISLERQNYSKFQFNTNGTSFTNSEKLYLLNKYQYGVGDISDTLMVVDHTGEVAIDTTAADSTLTVAGGVHAHGAVFDGNVGVGTNPVARLHVNLTDTTTNEIGRPLRLEHASTGTAASGFGVGIDFRAENFTETVVKAARIDAKMQTTNTSKLVLSTIYGADTFVEGLSVYNGGITTGSITASGDVLPGAADTYDLGGIGSEWDSLFVGDVIVDGNVGIGTTSPGAKLEVRGNDDNALATHTIGYSYWGSSISRGTATISSPASVDAPSARRVIFGNNLVYNTAITNGTHAGYQKMSNAIASAAVVLEAQTGIAGEILFINANDTDDDTYTINENMIIDSSGNVGIGTTSPSKKLQVESSTTTTGENLAAFFNDIAADGYNNNVIIGRSAAAADAAVFGYLHSTTTNNNAAFLTMYGNHPEDGILVNYAGNVGIGTTSPGAELEVRSSAPKIELSDNTGGTSRDWRIGISQVEEGDFYISQSTAADGTIFVDKMYIDSSGNVGIGTTSPSYKLEVNDIIKSKGLVVDNNNADGGNIVLNSSGYDAWNLDNYSGRFRMYRNVTEYLTMTASGEVGIGTSYPAQKLDVSEGNFRLDNTTGSNQYGIIYKGSIPWLHDYHGSGKSATPDGQNVFLGNYAGNFTVGDSATATYQGSRNVAIGDSALSSIELGYNNVAIGSKTMKENTDHIDNVAIGPNAMGSSTSDYSVGIGQCALYDTDGDYKIGIGNYALYSNTGAADYIAIGRNASRYDTTGQYDVTIGYAALQYSNGGQFNVAIGQEAGHNLPDNTRNTKSSYSTFLGAMTRPKASNDSWETVIGCGAYGHGSNTVTIGDTSYVTDTYIAGNIHTITNKGADIGTPTIAFDDVYADDFNNVADIPFFDDRNDLSLIMGIKVMRDTTDKVLGYKFVDDNSLPKEMMLRHRKARVDTIIKPIESRIDTVVDTLIAPKHRRVALRDTLWTTVADSLGNTENVVDSIVVKEKDELVRPAEIETLYVTKVVKADTTIKSYKPGDLVLSEDGKPYFNVRNTVGLLIGSIRQLNTKVDSLKDARPVMGGGGMTLSQSKRMDQMEARIDSLEARTNELESRVDNLQTILILVAAASGVTLIVRKKRLVKV